MEVLMADIINSLTSELKRGTLVLSVLSELKTKQYGYSLRESMADKGVDIEQGTLYPLLRRLEDQGLLDSEWSLTTSRPRRYYKINKTGSEVLTILIAEWLSIVNAMNQILELQDKSDQ
jgi:DNA-binding PadR family transcriptional regulator